MERKFFSLRNADRVQVWRAVRNTEEPQGDVTVGGGVHVNLLPPHDEYSELLVQMHLLRNLVLALDENLCPVQFEARQQWQVGRNHRYRSAVSATDFVPSVRLTSWRWHLLYPLLQLKRGRIPGAPCETERHRATHMRTSNAW